MKERQELLFGYHSVMEALNAGRRKIRRVLIAQTKASERKGKVEHLAGKRKIPVAMISADALDKQVGPDPHQGVAMECGSLPVEDGLVVARELEHQERPAFFLVLENIEDPHNFGAIVRSASCAGVDAIVIPKDRACQPTPAVSRSSAGALEHARICRVTNTAAFLRAFKKSGGWVSGLDAAGPTPLFEADLKGHLALVIGGEHKGIRPLVQKECDFLLSIPNLGPINSLNASVAGAVAMYEALRQRS